MKKYKININVAVNKFEQETCKAKLQSQKVLNSIFYQTIREVIRQAKAYNLDLIEDECIEISYGMYTVSICWDDITITNNLTNQTCDIMTYFKIGNVLSLYEWGN